MMDFIGNCWICQNKISWTSEPNSDRKYYCIKMPRSHIFAIHLMSNENSYKKLLFVPYKWHESSTLNSSRIQSFVDFQTEETTINIYPNFGKRRVWNHIHPDKTDKIIIPKILTMDFPNLEKYIKKIETYLTFL